MTFLQSRNMRIAAVIVAILLGVIGANYTRNMGLQKIESEEDMFSIYVPEEWTVEYADPSPTVDVSGAFAYDDTKENFLFIIVSPTETEDYEADLAAWQKQFEIVDFRYLTSEIKTHNGMEVAMYDASIMNGDVPYYQKGFITYANGNKYMVLAQCKDADKEEMTKVFDKSLKTFKLKSN